MEFVPVSSVAPMHIRAGTCTWYYIGYHPVHYLQVLLCTWCIFHSTALYCRAEVVGSLPLTIYVSISSHTHLDRLAKTRRSRAAPDVGRAYSSAPPRPARRRDTRSRSHKPGRGPSSPNTNGAGQPTRDLPNITTRLPQLQQQQSLQQD